MKEELLPAVNQSTLHKVFVTAALNGYDIDYFLELTKAGVGVDKKENTLITVSYVHRLELLFKIVKHKKFRAHTHKKAGNIYVPEYVFSEAASYPLTVKGARKRKHPVRAFFKHLRAHKRP